MRRPCFKAIGWEVTEGRDSSYHSGLALVCREVGSVILMYKHHKQIIYSQTNSEKMHKLDFLIFNYMYGFVHMSVVPTEARDNMGTLGSTITDYGELNSDLL